MSETKDEALPVQTPGEAPSSALVRYRYLVLVLVGALMFVAWLGSRDPWYPDEPDIAEVTRVMFETGDWVVPLRNGEAWVDYPPLLYWSACATSHAFGEVSPFTLRLPSALAAILLALLTCAGASRLYGPRAGLWAGILLLTFTQLVYNAVAHRPDMLFALFVGAGLLVYAAGVGARPRLWLRGLGFILLGLAVLTKGPLGLLLPGLVLTLWHVFRREWRRLLELAPLGLLALLVAAPWYALYAERIGAESLWREIYMQNVERFGSGVRYQGHIRPPWYYVVNIWGDLAPWSFLLPAAVWWAFKKRLTRVGNASLLLWWFATFFVFLTFAATKRQLYLLPAYPAMAILMAPWFASFSPAAVKPWVLPAKVFTETVPVLLLLIGTVGVAGAAFLDPIVDGLRLSDEVVDIVTGFRLPAGLTGLAAIGLGFWIGHAAWHKGWAVALGRAAATTIALWALLLGLVLPALDPVRTYAPAAHWVRDHIGGSTHFGLHYPERGRNRIGGFAYHSGRLVELLDDEAAVEDFFRRYPDSVVLVYEKVSSAFFDGAKAPWPERVVHTVTADRREYLVLKKD